MLLHQKQCWFCNGEVALQKRPHPLSIDVRFRRIRVPTSAEYVGSSRCTDCLARYVMLCDKTHTIVDLVFGSVSKTPKPADWPRQLPVFIPPQREDHPCWDWLALHSQQTAEQYAKEHGLITDDPLKPLNTPVLLTGTQLERDARGCIGKVRYDTEGKAKQMAHDCYVKRGADLRVYRCNLCAGWHLTKYRRRPRA